MAKDYYAILGVTNTASVEDVKKAYRQLAKFYHPDKYPHASAELLKENEDKLKEINEAYKIVLKETQKREKDTLGKIFNTIFNPKEPKVKTEADIIKENEIAFDEFQEYYLKIKDRMLEYHLNLVTSIDRLLNPANRGQIMAYEFKNIKVMINDAINNYISALNAYDELMQLIAILEPKYNEFGQTLKPIKDSLKDKRGQLSLDTIMSYTQKIKNNYRHIKNQKIKILKTEINDYATKIGIDTTYLYQDAAELFKLNIKDSLPNLELLKKTIIEQLAIYGEKNENLSHSATTDLVENIKAYNDLMSFIDQIEISYKRYGSSLTNLKEFLKPEKGMITASKVKALMLLLRVDFKLLKQAKLKDLQVEVLNLLQSDNELLKTYLKGRQITELSYFELSLIKDDLVMKKEYNIFEDEYPPQKIS